MKGFESWISEASPGRSAPRNGPTSSDTTLIFDSKSLSTSSLPSSNSNSSSELQLQHELSSLRKSNTTLRDELQHAETARNDLEDRIAELQQSLNSARLEAKQVPLLREQVRQLRRSEDALTESQAEKAAIQQQSLHNERTANRLKVQLEDALQQIETLKTSSVTLESPSFQKVVDERVHSETAMSNGRISSLQEEISRQNAEIAELRSELGGVAARFSASQGSSRLEIDRLKADHAAELEAAEERFQQQLRSKDQAQREVERLHGVVRTLELAATQPLLAKPQPLLLPTHIAPPPQAHSNDISATQSSRDSKLALLRDAILSMKSSAPKIKKPINVSRTVSRDLRGSRLNARLEELVREAKSPRPFQSTSSPSPSSTSDFQFSDWMSPPQYNQRPQQTSSDNLIEFGDFQSFRSK